MRNIIKNIETEEFEKANPDLIIKNFNIRKIKMKTRILISSLLTVIFLVAFSGCNISKKTTAETSMAGRVIINTDSNLSDNTDEQIIGDNANYNAQGRGNVNSDYVNSENPVDNMNYSNIESVSDNSNIQDEEILNDAPNSDGEVENLETFESTLSNDGSFINVTQEEIDPDNNTSLELATVDEDIFPSTIWVPNSNCVSEGWNPYANGRWVWSSYGWYWNSNYRWHATYHYGRWWYSHRYGWVWSPGRRWSPAWVEWGHHRNYEGWHPISPRVHIQRRGVISPVMPHGSQTGWVIVKKNDFTKTVNSTTIIPYSKTNDIIKNSTLLVTLKQDGKRLYNEGPDINLKKNEINKIKLNEKNSVTQVTTKQNSEKNSVSSVINSKTKQNNTNVATNTQVKESTKNKVTKTNSTVITTPNSTKKETQKKITEKKNNNSVVVSPTPYKQNNTVNSNKNNTVEKKTNTSVTTTPVTKQNNTVNINKTTVKETPKKTVETKPVQVEKTRNSNFNSNSNNSYNSTKTVYTPPVVKESPRVVETPKVRESPKVTETPKVRESPKVTESPKVSPQQKNGNKK